MIFENNEQLLCAFLSCGIGFLCGFLWDVSALLRADAFERRRHFWGDAVTVFLLLLTAYTFTLSTENGRVSPYSWALILLGFQAYRMTLRRWWLWFLRHWQRLKGAVRHFATEKARRQTIYMKNKWKRPHFFTKKVLQRKTKL